MGWSTVEVGEGLDESSAKDCEEPATEEVGDGERPVDQVVLLNAIFMLPDCTDLAL